MAVEPWSTFPSDYDAVNGRGLLHLESGARLETELRCELFRERED